MNLNVRQPFRRTAYDPESVHKWLSPPDPSTNHNAACATHHKRKATWFVEGSTFREWKTTGSLLWIHGKRAPCLTSSLTPSHPVLFVAGSGKSILWFVHLCIILSGLPTSSVSSTIIENIAAMQRKAVMVYFDFDFKNVNKQHLHDLIPSFLSQLSAGSRPHRDILSRLYKDHYNGKTRPSDPDLVICLKQMFRLPDKRPIYLVMDALDECPDASGIPSPREQVLQIVKELVDLHLPNLHICVTSRPEIDIRDVLEPLNPFQVSLHEQSGQKEDIMDYVKLVVDSDSIMKRWKTEDKELVIETLSEGADGM